jgi:hypothetical protein
MKKMMVRGPSSLIGQVYRRLAEKDQIEQVKSGHPKLKLKVTRQLRDSCFLTNVLLSQEAKDRWLWPFCMDYISPLYVLCFICIICILYVLLYVLCIMYSWLLCIMYSSLNYYVLCVLHYYVLCILHLTILHYISSLDFTVICLICFHNRWSVPPIHKRYFSPTTRPYMRVLVLVRQLSSDHEHGHGPKAVHLPSWGNGRYLDWDIAFYPSKSDWRKCLQPKMWVLGLFNKNVCARVRRPKHIEFNYSHVVANKINSCRLRHN